MVRVGAFGTYSMRVFDAERFLKELFGTNSTFTVADINDHLKSLLVSQMADTVAESKIPMLDMAANLQEFSAMCRTNITEKFREYGLDITSFTIENISLPQEVEKVLDERTSLGILGDKMGTYTQKKAADALGDAARNTGTVGTFMGVGMGGAFGNAMNNAFSNLGNAQDAAPKQETKPKQKYCGECGAAMSVGAKFCPECGAKQSSGSVCVKCGADVKGKKFCPECGTKVEN